jgi:hypothetical protein
MANRNKDGQYEIGYKKPPRDSQFQPGKSGNPKGRPKRSETVADVLQKELNSRVPILKHGKRQKISMLRAIIKQHLNKAAAGDAKSAAIFFNALRLWKTDSGDKLGALVQEFRALHLRHKAFEPSEKDIVAENQKNPEPR